MIHKDWIQQGVGVKHGNSYANRMVNKILLIINPLTCFGSLLSQPQKQYDVVHYKEKFFLSN